VKEHNETTRKEQLDYVWLTLKETTSIVLNIGETISSRVERTEFSTSYHFSVEIVWKKNIKLNVGKCYIKRDK